MRRAGVRENAGRASRIRPSQATPPMPYARPGRYQPFTAKHQADRAEGEHAGGRDERRRSQPGGRIDPARHLRDRRSERSFGPGLGSRVDGHVTTFHRAASILPAEPCRRLVLHDRARIIGRSGRSQHARRVDHPAGVQRGRAPQTRSRPRPRCDECVRVQLRDHHRRRRFLRRFGRARSDHPRRARAPIPAEPRLGLGPQGGHERRPRARHRVDRRRHDVPERHHPAAGERARGLRPGRRRAHHRRGHDEEPPRAGQVVHPQASRASSRRRRSPTSTRVSARSAPTSPASTCVTCPRASRASRR